MQPSYIIIVYRVGKIDYEKKVGEDRLKNALISIEIKKK